MTLTMVTVCRLDNFAHVAFYASAAVAAVACVCCALYRLNCM